MTEDERLDLAGKFRYKVIDMIESGHGRWVAVIVFGTAWGSLALWWLP